MTDATIQQRRGGDAGAAFRIVMALGLLLTLAANAPGHLSLDSVVTLVEARTGVRQTWAPAAASWLLKPFNRMVGGTGLYVAASSALLFLSLMALTRLRPRATWLAVALGALAVLTPQILLYQGIVWRDVLFANLTIAGFVLLAHVARAWGAGRPIPALVGAFVCLALAALVRQNGLLLVVAAAGALAWTARGGGWRASLGWGLGALIATFAVTLALNPIATPPAPHLAPPKPGEAPRRTPPRNATALILQHYDVIGARAQDPNLRLDEIGKADPKIQELIETEAPRTYSPARIDTLDANPALGKAMWRVPPAAMQAQWLRIVTHDPAAYLRHRAEVFRWTFLTPDLSACLPITVGVSGPKALLDDLNIEKGIDTRDQHIGDYAKRFYGTPVFSHLTWAVVAVSVIVWLSRRRDPADGVIVALLGGALAFAASFAVISVACDYRYLYLLDLAAIVGVLYTALDPPRWRKA